MVCRCRVPVCEVGRTEAESFGVGRRNRRNRRAARFRRFGGSGGTRQFPAEFPGSRSSAGPKPKVSASVQCPCRWAASARCLRAGDLAEDGKFGRTDGRADARAGGRAGWRTDEERTDGRTDHGRTVDGRPDEIRKLLYMKISKFEFSDFHENSKFGRTLGRTDGRAGWRTRGLADGRRTDGGRTAARVDEP